MARMNQMDNLRYPWLFSLLFVIQAIVLSQVVQIPTERLLLPLLHPVAEPTEEPLRVINNDGTLSNGDKLQGWRNRVYFISYGLLWLTACTVATVAVVRVWPAKEATGATTTPDQIGTTTPGTGTPGENA
jgi:hypothetical protein